MKIIDIVQEYLNSQERDLKWLAEKIDIKYSSLWYRFKEDKLSGYDLAKIGKFTGIDLNKIKEGVE